MVKTQVQIPDQLYREAKRIAEENEMSFAEVVRRGIEQIIHLYPRGRKARNHWAPPAPHDLGAALVPESRWTELSHDKR